MSMVEAPAPPSRVEVDPEVRRLALALGNNTGAVVRHLSSHWTTGSTLADAPEQLLALAEACLALRRKLI